MAKPITFKVPVKNRRGKVTLVDATGFVANLRVGLDPVKFVLQISRATGKPEKLTHYATGGIVGSINDAKVRAMVSRGHHARPNDRQAAQELIDRVVSQYGLDKVLATFAASEVINR